MGTAESEGDKKAPPHTSNKGSADPQGAEPSSG